MLSRSVPLADYTSLKVGGVAEKLYTPSTYDEVNDILVSDNDVKWILGFGSNVLISDEGLPGSTIMWRGGEIVFENNLAIVDAGVWWDDFVKAAIEHNLWGVELMSEIPSSVGGAVFGNIAAYGQQLSDSLAWVEVYDTTSQSIYQLAKEDINFAYRSSSLQQEPHRVIMRAAFALSSEPTHKLAYDSALALADELGLSANTLEDCRKIIIETRQRAGSIYHPDDPQAERTAGSFFKNPMVTTEQAKELASFDESGKTLERIIHQSQIHGGSAQRASAAHVLLAAGFSRGQTWGNVKLHDRHVLKVETLPGAKAQEVYDVSRHIIDTVKTKLGIDIEAEVKLLGKF